VKPLIKLHPYPFAAKRLIAPLLIALWVMAASACSSTPPPPTAPPAPPAGPPPYTGLHLETLGQFQAVFEVQFHGTFDWSYRLETRADGHAVEYRLHLDGLNASVNPGDVRLVSQDNVSRMLGPGTDNECVVFPSDLPQGPTFLSPDDLVPPAAVNGSLEPEQIEILIGVDTIHYTVATQALGEWSNAQMEFWRDESTGAVLRHEIQGSGTDPYFGAGAGTVAGHFVVNQIGPQTIEPIDGCGIDLPLPADNTRLVKLPGLIGFESASSPEQVSAFFQAELPASGWAAAEEPQTSEGVIVLSYLREQQTLEINIEPRASGAHVELLLGNN
jgi:hypothetical protein